MRSISSSHTVLQNSIACSATFSFGLRIPFRVNCFVSSLHLYQLLAETYTEQSPLHVECHLFVVKRHDSDKTLVCANLHIFRCALSGFANDLHDVITFALLVSPSSSIWTPWLTSRSKLSRMNSNELYNAVMAALWTAMLVSSFRAPCTTAVRISLDRAARISGSYIKSARSLYDTVWTTDSP